MKNVEGRNEPETLNAGNRAAIKPAGPIGKKGKVCVGCCGTSCFCVQQENATVPAVALSLGSASSLVESKNLLCQLLGHHCKELHVSLNIRPVEGKCKITYETFEKKRFGYMEPVFSVKLRTCVLEAMRCI